ncbi:hypothetical protein B7P43_G15493 [Cryptotermes secundus]|uniref:Uncharacterized protein n=1 Tax=Cryptotermes secundus TaxID=105785 RepID=A0A2J7R0K4_9NEOP|nr:hypothetical protein B7P43_G15493 [Cryptotermes secundus]
MANYFACMCLMRIVLPLSLSLSEYSKSPNPAPHGYRHLQVERLPVFLLINAS